MEDVVEERERKDSGLQGDIATRRGSGDLGEMSYVYVLRENTR